MQTAAQRQGNRGSLGNRDFIFNLRISHEFRFIQFVYHWQKYAKQNL